MIQLGIQFCVGLVIGVQFGIIEMCLILLIVEKRRRKR